MLGFESVVRPMGYPAKTAGRFRALTPLALLAGLLQANPALAQEFTSAGLGVFVGYGKESVAWGFEVFGSAEFEDDFCDNSARQVVGPLFRFVLYGASQPSFTLTGHAGTEVQPTLAVTGELGLSVGMGKQPDAGWSISPHTGFGTEFLYLTSFAHQDWLLDAFPVAGGIRFMPLAADPLVSFCAVGRPQRDSAGRRVDPTKTQNPRLSRSGSDDAAYAADWKADAEAEYASVPAFIRLARELEAAGAPRQLVVRALAAARDELRHTRLCSEAASCLSRRPYRPTPPRVALRPPLSGPAALQRLAVESWLDGCLGEGLAAALAEDAADLSPNIISQKTHETIAADEQRHAKLAWDILRWCLAADRSVAPLLRTLAPSTSRAPGRASGCARRRARLARAYSRQQQQRLLRYL